MIPLNKPGHRIRITKETDYLNLHFPNRNVTYCYTAGDCLNLLYKYLYEQRGALRIGVSPMTCYQAILPMVYNGHIPVLLDIDKQTLNIDANRRDQWPEMDAIEVIHLGGNPCDMGNIMDYAEKHNLLVIEDCAQALGVLYNGKICGCFGDYAIISTLKNIYQPGGILLSKEPITPPINSISCAVKVYKIIKDKLEGKCNHRKHNIWNNLYKTLLAYRSKESLFANTMRTLPPRMVVKVLENLPGIEDLNRIRIQNFQTIINGLKNPHIKVIINKGSANRIFLLCDEPKASQYIKTLRQKGIAANNLTQSYLNGYQKPIWEVPELVTYYNADQLPIYTSVYNHVIAIPNSPYLTNEEIDYIIKTINSL
ncbi:MAG: DegT/DnrJ/EryC1/StrS family aminotransferase [Prevotellaceae bacterium]|nr:DegT/DnrJ/EryC1/StrS family aminotransferase [Candidatus Faecinaster equi]